MKTYLEELMQKRALYGLDPAAAPKALLQHCLAMAAKAAADSGARQQHIWAQHLSRKGILSLDFSQVRKKQKLFSKLNGLRQ